MENTYPVKVAVRVRPLSANEIINGATSCVDVLFEKSQISISSEKKYNFDYVMDENYSQQQLYKKCVQPLIRKVIKGFNATVLAYGQSGTGKSYTIGSDCNIQNKGIISYVLDDLFIYSKEDSNIKCSIDISFIEICNKDIYDLFTERKKIQIQELSNETKLHGIKIINVSSTDDAISWLKKGSKVQRNVSNISYLHSNRSHAIFIIYFHYNQITSKLYLVDLAGSETAHTKDQNMFKEGVHVNLGLLALEHVMNSLNNKNQKTHKPYRNSILTRVLKDCLNEETFTLLIACISSADLCLKESMNTLRYALRARYIKNRIVVSKQDNISRTINASTSVENKTEDHPLSEVENINPCYTPVKTVKTFPIPTKLWNNDEFKTILTDKNVRRKSQRLLKKKTEEVPKYKVFNKDNLKKVQLKHNKAILKFINTGTENELKKLPFIGAKSALAIKSHQNIHGPFKSLLELKEVQGFSEVILNRFLKTNIISLE